MEPLNFNKIKSNIGNSETNQINELGLKERKKKVLEELKNEKLTTIQMDNLISLDNINEELICRYIISLNKDITKGDTYMISNCSNLKNIFKLNEVDIVFKVILQYSNYISSEKLSFLKQTIYGKANKDFRNFSFKSLLFTILSAIKNDDIKELKKQLGILNITIKQRKWNNQPFDSDNFEALYFYLCILFSNQIENYKNNKDQYFENLKELTINIKEINEYSTCKNYEKEKKDIKKFLIIIFALLNLDSNNYEDISHIAMILNAPSEQDKKEMISSTCRKIKAQYGIKRAEQFKQKLFGNDNFCSLDYKLVGNEIELLEESYLYDYIMNNNIFKKYEKQIIELLNIIFKSDLIKQLLRVVYSEDYEKIENILEKEYSVEEFFNNVILFVPFKMKRISGFSYRNIFKIFISIYKLKHLETDLENEIFTLGAFVRIFTHEALGPFIVSYIFFIFYANQKDIEEYYFSHRMNEKIKNLNKKNYIELIGNTLATIELNILNDINIKLTTENNKIVEKTLNDEFKKIIGNEYAEILSKKLIEIKMNEKENQSNNEYENLYKNEKVNFLYKKAEEIIDILFQCISDDFEKVIKDLDLRQETYKDYESGNVIELLLFNDFSQYMTLKECLFLLDEENFRNTNLFKFRSEFKGIARKNNDEFLKDIKKDNKIFVNLFSQYYSIYENNKYTQKDFITSKTFRENRNNNFIKKYEAFSCKNVKIDVSILPNEPDFNS